MDQNRTDINCGSSDEARKTTKELVIHLDEELGLDSVMCTPDLQMVLHFTSPTSAKALHRRMENWDVLLARGLEWLCMDESNFPQVIIHPMEAAPLIDGARVTFHTSAAKHQVLASSGITQRDQLISLTCQLPP